MRTRMIRLLGSHWNWRVQLRALLVALGTCRAHNLLAWASQVRMHWQAWSQFPWISSTLGLRESKSIHPASWNSLASQSLLHNIRLTFYGNRLFFSLRFTLPGAALNTVVGRNIQQGKSCPKQSPLARFSEIFSQSPLQHACANHGFHRQQAKTLLFCFRTITRLHI